MGTIPEAFAVVAEEALFDAKGFVEAGNCGVFDSGGTALFWTVNIVDAVEAESSVRLAVAVVTESESSLARFISCRSSMSGKGRSLPWLEPSLPCLSEKMPSSLSTSTLVACQAGAAAAVSSPGIPQSFDTCPIRSPRRSGK